MGLVIRPQLRIQPERTEVGSGREGVRVTGTHVTGGEAMGGDRKATCYG